VRREAQSKQQQPQRLQSSPIAAAAGGPTPPAQLELGTAMTRFPPAANRRTTLWNPAHPVARRPRKPCLLRLSRGSAPASAPAKPKTQRKHQQNQQEQQDAQQRQEENPQKKPHEEQEQQKQAKKKVRPPTITDRGKKGHQQGSQNSSHPAAGQ